MGESVEACVGQTQDHARLKHVMLLGASHQGVGGSQKKKLAHFLAYSLDIFDVALPSQK